MRRRRPPGGERGSILVLTLFAVGLLVGSILYVGVIGSRVSEVTRARGAAAATPLASATIKARTLNYEAFIVLADTVLLPLGEIAGFLASHPIPDPQAAQVHLTVSGWMTGLETMAETLDTVGVYWAAGE